MELKLIPYKENIGLQGGILIKNPDVYFWIQEIARMGFQLSEIDICPIPSLEANRLWGCLLVSSKNIDLGKNNYCRLLGNILFLPEYTSIYPILSDEELITLLDNKKHIFHPDFNLYCIEEILDITQILCPNNKIELCIETPQSPLQIPEHILSFEVKMISAEDILHQMETEVISNKKTFTDKPLSSFEKLKLIFYKMLWKEDGKNKKQKTKIQETLSSILNENFLQKTKSELEDLEARNKKEIDKLIDLFDKNIEEALEYAIPLNDSGSLRGSSGDAVFQLKRNNYSGNGRVGGTVNLQDDVYESLRSKYQKSAKELYAQKNFKKAAYIYLKLLREYHNAAITLETGKYYKEAAAIYIEHIHNELKGAECFEKAGLIEEAIALYKKMNDKQEKIGDLYLSIGKKTDAITYFQLCAEKYISNKQYLKASFIYKNKMDEWQLAQNVLIEGWRTNCDAFNCLNNYLNNIHEIDVLEQEIKNLYRNEVNDKNEEIFISVMEHEYKKGNSLAEGIKGIVYELISKKVGTNKKIVNRLIDFNVEDPLFVKDTIRYQKN